MLKIGLMGANDLGWQHAEAIQGIKKFNLSGIFDPNRKKANTLAKKFNIYTFDSPEELMYASDAVSVLSSDAAIVPLISDFIKASKHLFIEPSLLDYTIQGETLLHLSEEAKTKIQIGYNDRFHAAFIAAKPYIEDPLFIEAKQTVPYLPIYTHTSVVDDFMVNDIDVILSLVKGNIKRVHATGINIFSTNPDVVNAYLEFDNGTNVNLTVDRTANKKTRTFHCYKHFSRVDIDFLKPKVQMLEKNNNQSFIRTIKTSSNHSLSSALSSFYETIEKNAEPSVSINNAYQARQIAALISQKIEIISKTE